MADTDPKRILHVDMDAFFVAVELLRRPDLRGLPVVVGGTGSRGVVAAASYEARRFGVYSAMSSAQARRLCPNAVFLPGDLHLYADYSERVHEVFNSFSPEVEGVALDEAFIDVTGSVQLFGEASSIGVQIRDRVLRDTGLVCCVGVASNKFLAKLASRAAKPKIVDGQIVDGPGVFEVTDDYASTFLEPMSVRSLWGVGAATVEKLERFGVATVADLKQLERRVLTGALGQAAGSQLFDLARGIDPRPVVSSRDAKSIGHEETFAEDIIDLGELRTHLVRLSDAVAARVRRADVAARTVSLKIRYSDFSNLTRSFTPEAAVTTGQAIVSALDRLLPQCEIERGVRLAGVSVSNFVESQVQLTLDTVDSEPSDGDWMDAADAIDEIRKRFGNKSIGPLSAMGHGRDLGESPWGPSH